MEIIRGPLNLKPRHRGSVVTIGNFDGVHRGHQAILKQVTDKAAELGVPSMLICFEPQPQEFFDEFNAPARLTRFREKVELLEDLGLDLVFCLKFDEKTRSMSAEGFLDFLTSDLAVSALFVGDGRLPLRPRSQRRFRATTRGGQDVRFRSDQSAYVDL